MKPIHLFILYFSQHRNEAYICTSTDTQRGDLHLYRRMRILAPFFCAICTSIDALELDPSAYADLKESKRCEEGSSRRGDALVRTVLRATGIDSFQKKESVDLGTRCTGKTPSKRRNQ